MIVLTEDEKKFRRWQICSAEVAKLFTEFENGTALKENEHSEFHLFYHMPLRVMRGKFGSLMLR